MESGSTPVLHARSVAKKFGATVALRDATLRLSSGRVHAMLGENGAGKSTLVKILAGAEQRDRGEIRLAGSTVDFTSVGQAIASGIVAIYQHLSLFPELSVHENLSAFSLGGARGLSTRSALVPADTARNWLSQIGLDVPLDIPVTRLSLGERQLVEIARGLGQSCRVLILDEPTAALTSTEAERLFAVVRRLCATGTAVLFISHKLDEVEALADEVTVLRDGRTVVDAAQVASLSRDELVREMIGHSIHSSDRTLPGCGEIVLRARSLRALPASAPLDLQVRAGEIVALVGLVGSGALKIASVLAGAQPAVSGMPTVGEVPLTGGRRHAVALGVGYVPSDRNLEGLFAVRSAAENASASVLGSVSQHGVLGRSREAARVEPWLQRLKLHPLDAGLAAQAFSGGNQQKIVVARNLAMTDLRVLVLLEPTRGVDIAARETIHDAIVDAAQGGAAVILATTDLDEAIALSHRCLIVRGGSVVREIGSGSSRETFLAALAERAAA
jgi:ABC-type sugar transport system ATPase subunit